MDAAVVGLIVLGAVVFSVGMLSARNVVKYRSHAQESPQKKVDESQTASAKNPIEKAAVGAGQDNLASIGR